LCCAIAAPSAFGRTTFGALIGYNKGTLSREIDESFTGVSTQGYLGYQFWRLEARAFFQHMDLKYKSNNENFNGIYTMAGLGLGSSQSLGRGTFSAFAQVPLTGSYIVLSETEGTVKGTEYIHSTLITLQGGQAYQLLLGYQFRIIGSGKKTAENLHLGTFLGYLRQNFASQTTRVKTNNSELEPQSPGTEACSCSATLTSLNFSLNYEL